MQSKSEKKYPIIPVILCGGASRRLWPMTIPKQFLHLNGEHSLLQQTVQRLAGIEGLERPIFSCNRDYEQPVQAQMASIGITSYDFIAEPFPRNTAPAFLLSALWAQQKYGDKAVLLFLPSDHMIDDSTQTYSDALKQAILMAQQERMATIGLTPQSAHPGFGYIKKGNEIKNSASFTITEFIEKPTPEEAETLLESGNYCWNSGIYVMQVQSILKEAQAYCPKLLEAAQQAFSSSNAYQNASGSNFLVIDEESYALCEEVPFDKAISEKTQLGVVTEGEFQWKDLGHWSSIAEANHKDALGNVISGNIHTQGVRDCYIHTSSNKPVIALGIEDLVLIDTPNGLLITKKGMDQYVKMIMQQFEENPIP